jgi:Skp family chaperone for outer membrane proteins
VPVPRTDRLIKSLSDAQHAYETARASYLAGSRELRSKQRRLGGGRVEDNESGSSGSKPSAAAIGSIDMDAVFKRYEKVRQANDQLKAFTKAKQERSAKLLEQRDKLSIQIQKVSPESSEFSSLESQLVAVKSQYETEREAAERESSRRQTRTTAALYEEIQQMTAVVARAKGMNYVVKVSPGPNPNSDPNVVMNALNGPIVYSDPHNDLTEEVIHELNQKFKANGDKTSRK